MKMVLCLLFGLFFSLFQNVNAAYIVVKKEGNEIVALDKSDKKNAQAIWSVFKKYQWPMCLANKDLTKDDIRELFFSEKNVEEPFLRSKLQEINSDYDVIFVPTVLAQLFLLSQAYIHNHDYHLFSIETFEYSDGNLSNIFRNLDKKIKKIVQGKNSQLIHVYKEYSYIIDEMEWGYFTFTKRFYRWIQEFGKSGNLSITTSAHIQNNVQELLKKLLVKVEDAYKSMNKENVSQKKHINQEDLRSVELITEGSTLKLKKKSMLKKCIECEYQSQLNNKFLLFRADSFIKQCVSRDKKSVLVDSTFNACYEDFTDNTIRLYEPTCESRSISYSNNILDGVVNDLGACTYDYFLKGKKCVYVLSLDKSRYWLNRYNKLFFISPLDYLNATFAEGELFHSRSVGVVDSSHQATGGETLFTGIDFGLTDNIGMLTVARDPFLHEAMFSEVFLKHAIILKGNRKKRE